MEMNSIFGVGAAASMRDTRRLAEKAAEDAFIAYDMADMCESGKAEYSDEELVAAKRRALDAAKALLEKLREQADTLERAIRRSESAE